MESQGYYLELLQNFVVTYGLKLIGALVALIIGLWIIRLLTGGLTKFMQKRGIDTSLQGFFRTLFNITMKVLLVLSIVSMVGFKTTSFIAVLGAAGLAVGMALSGTLQNFAGGVIILLLKPFKAGDFIEAQGFMGTVSEVQIFNTILKTPDNKTIIIPNGGLSTSSMTNFSTEPQRRVDWTFGISYGEDTEKAKALIMELIKSDQRVLREPEPFIAISELAASSVNISVRVWVESADFWGLFFDINERVYNAFKKEGINIPFPQMDVHLYRE